MKGARANAAVAEAAAAAAAAEAAAAAAGRGEPAVALSVEEAGEVRSGEAAEGSWEGGCVDGCRAEGGGRSCAATRGRGLSLCAGAEALVRVLPRVRVLPSGSNPPR